MSKPLITIETAWHPGRAAPRPIELLREVLSALDEGRPVRQDAAAHLSGALRRFLKGEHDITANLGLRSGKGKRAQPSLERKAERDSHIRSIYQLLPGGRTERAKRTAALLSSPAGSDVRVGEITEGDVMAHLAELHREHGSNLPRSWPHILRVVDAEQ